MIVGRAQLVGSATWCLLLLLLGFGFVPHAYAATNTAQQNCLSATGNNPKCLRIDPGSACVTNGYLAAEVNTPSDISDVGVYTFAVGGCPISDSTSDPNMILFPLGTSFNSVKVDDTNTIYTEGGGCYDTETGFTVVCLDNVPATVTTLTSTEVAITWGPTAENLYITQDIGIHGTTGPTTTISMHMTVRNAGSTSHTVSVRYMLDLFVGDYDGTWIREYNGITPGTILGYETDFNPPPSSFTAYQMGECPGPDVTPPSCTAPPSGTFGTTGPSLYASISSPPGVTVPDRFVYGYWGTMIDSVFAYTANPAHLVGSPVTNVDSGQDSAVMYFFGDPVVPPGQTLTVAGGAFSNAPTAVIVTGAPEFPLGTLLMVAFAFLAFAAMRMRKAGARVPAYAA